MEQRGKTNKQTNKQKNKNKTKQNKTKKPNDRPGFFLMLQQTNIFFFSPLFYALGWILVLGKYVLRVCFESPFTRMKWSTPKYKWPHRRELKLPEILEVTIFC